MDGRVPLPRQLSRANAYTARAVVRYVAEHPGSSNKAIAHGVEVWHLEQISRLLSRLERTGLLAKRAGGAGRPNAWTLTPYGQQVVELLARHSPRR